MKRSYDKTTSTKTFKKKKGISKGDYQKGRELAKTPKQELKAFDVALTNQAFSLVATPPAFNVLNALVNGAELYQRVGRKIYMKSLHIRGLINNTATSAQDIIRIIVYYDSQPNTANPTIVGLIQDSNAAAASSGISEINLFNRQRFKILRDFQIMAPSVTNAAGVLTNIGFYDQNQNFTVDMFIKLKGLESVYNGMNGGTVADITSGSIGIVCVSTDVNNTWQFTFTSRLRYYD